MRKATVARPYVRLDATHRRLSILPDTDETNLVCQDTGEVVYTTPNYTWAGTAKSASAALGRAKAWLTRHGFRYDAADHGYWTRPRGFSEPCTHSWDEQPGEPPVDVCVDCGAVRR